MSAPRLIRDDGTVLELPERGLLGRDASCEVVVNDKSVSRRHALVERRGDAWWVVDQGSANGIFVGGLRVAEGMLVDGQEFALGLVRFRVELPASPAKLMDEPEGGTLLIPVSALAPPALPPVPRPVDPRDEAAMVLGVAADAPPAEVGERLAALESELAERIRTAPNAHLRATYTASLEGARAAAAVLLPPAPPVPEVSAADLPSAQPVVGSHIVDEVRAAGRQAPSVAPARTSAPTGPPQSTMIVASLAVILVGLSLFFWLSSRATREALRDLRGGSDTQKVVAANAALEATRRLVAAGVLENGRVALCNSGSQPIEIRWLGALWTTRGPAGDLRIDKFMSRDTRCVTDQSQLARVDVLVPGERKSTVAAGSCTWDGRALFVAVEYSLSGSDGPSRHAARVFGKGEHCLDLASPAAGTVPAEAPAQ